MIMGFLAPFSFTEVFAVFVEGFNMRFDIEKGSSQFMKTLLMNWLLASLSSTSRVMSCGHVPLILSRYWSRTVVRRIRMVRLVGWMRVIRNSALSRSPAAIWYRDVLTPAPAMGVMQNICSYHITTVPAKIRRAVG